MSISERITGTVENWRKLWGETLKKFLIAVVSFGLEVFMDIIGKAFAPKLKPLIDELKASPELPDWLRPILDEISEPTGQVGALLAQSAGGALVGGAIGSIADALLLRFSYDINRRIHPKLPNEGQMIAFWLRGAMTDESLQNHLRSLGADDITITILKELSQVRLPPETIAALWRRDKTGYEYLWKDLADSGVTPDRIVALKELAFTVPTPQDVVLFMGREAFEEDSVTKYGLDNEFERVDLKWFEQAGVKPEVAKLYWRAHWVHPAFREMTELLHRGEVTEDDVYEWYRLVEIPPYWRDKLTSISWDLPNRIELRMMARMGLVDKAFLVKQLKMVGLREDFRDIAADMMLSLGVRTDVSTRYRNGWIRRDEVKSELEATGLSAEVVDRLFKWIVKDAGGDRVVKERDLTKAEITKGVKKGVIPASQGVELLIDMGYDRDEAEYIITINVGVLEGSPETYMEFKKWTQLYRVSQGKTARIPSEELIQAEKDAKELDTDEAKIRFNQLLKKWTEEK